MQASSTYLQVIPTARVVGVVLVIIGAVFLSMTCGGVRHDAVSMERDSCGIFIPVGAVLFVAGILASLVAVVSATMAAAPVDEYSGGKGRIL